MQNMCNEYYWDMVHFKRKFLSLLLLETEKSAPINLISEAQHDLLHVEDKTCKCVTKSILNDNS